MTGAESLAKFACPACGADAHWHPGRQKLVCPYCGSESDVPPPPGPVLEHDLAQALAGLAGAPKGWEVARRSVQCQSCRAISVLDPARQAQRCEFCGAAQLLPYDETPGTFRPGSVLPFVVSATAAREHIRAWYGRLWLAPGALRRRALTDTVHGVYLPYWTFDAHVRARWTAESGHYHFTTQTYVENGQVRTRQVREVRWQPAAGTLEHFFDDHLVCASVGVRADLLRRIEPFPTGTLKPYDAAYVSGWVVERYQIDLVAGARRARTGMGERLVGLCAARVPGDTQRNLQVSADWSGQTFKHVLVPVWLLSYDYGRRRYQCAINGVTGAIAGDHPKSAWKIAALVVALVVAVVIVLSLGGR